MNKEEADRKHLDINKQEQQMESLQKSFQKCTENIRPINEEFKRIQKIEEQLSSISTAMAKAETEYARRVQLFTHRRQKCENSQKYALSIYRLKNEKQNANQLRIKIKTLYAGDESQLKREIEAYEQEYAQKQRNLADTQAECQAAKGRLQKIVVRLEDMDREYTKLTQAAGREQELYEERAIHITNLCRRLEITPDFNVSNCNERATAFIPVITEKLDARRSRGVEMENGFRNVEAELEREIGKYREDEVRLRSEIESLDKQCRQLDADLSTQKKSVDCAEGNRKALSDVQQKIKRLQEAKAQFERSCNQEELSTEITRIREQQNEIDEDIENITMQIMMSDTYATLQRDVAAKEQHIAERNSEIKRLKNKHRENLIRLFGDNKEEGNFRKRVETLNQSLQTKVNRLDAVIREQSRDKIELTANVRTTKNDLKQVESEIGRMEEEIDAMCESTPFVEVLSSTKENVKRLQMEHSSLKSSENYYKR